VEDACPAASRFDRSEAVATSVPASVSRSVSALGGRAMTQTDTLAPLVDDRLAELLALIRRGR
jgi:hypothetical protein